MSSSPVSVARDKDVAIVTIDYPPVNALGQPVRQGLLAAFDRLARESGVSAIVLVCAGRTFVAGADIREFDKPEQPPSWEALFERIENAKVPIVAAIHGTALGGGLELALCCHYRVAVAAARVGLPEIKLGILPGAGGTQRLPRLAPLDAALDMIMTGQPVPAPRAKELGVLDRLVDGELLAGAVAFAREIGPRGIGGRRIRDLPVKPPGSGTPAELFAKTRKELERRARGQVAPFNALAAVEASQQGDFAAGLAREKALFEACMASPQSAALMHVFFAEREAAKIPDLPADTPTRPIEKVAIIGAGTMGRGIGLAVVNAGLTLYLRDRDEPSLNKGLDYMRAYYAARAAAGRMSQAQADAHARRIHGVLDDKILAEVDLVIEAVFEDMALKKDVFRRLDAAARQGAILATNTSNLDIDEIAAVTKRPQDVIGMHFFSPANVMRLLEVVRAAKTGKDVLATIMRFSKTLAKVPVLARVCDGFIGNRLLGEYARQAEFLIEEGASPYQVDKALTDFGLAMGPFAVADLSGLDIGWQIRQRQIAELPPGHRFSSIEDRLYERGRLGQKSGAGWYRYEPGNRTPLPDPLVEQIVVEESRRLGMTRRPIADDEIVKRCMYPLVNEGAKLLDEGIALRAGDIDVAYVNGYGFPAWRGGPMYWGEVGVGLAGLLADVRKFHEIHGSWWRPAALLERLVAENKTFAEFTAALTLSLSRDAGEGTR